MKFLKLLLPMPGREPRSVAEQHAQDDKQALRELRELRGFSTQELDAYQQAAQRILDYESSRKTAAEARATTYIAAIATLVTLMTWALGNTTPFCSSTEMCRSWSLFFDASIAYFLFAAYWSVRTLAVSNYTAIGVEDLVQIKEEGRPLGRELLVQSLIVARANRQTINQKLSFVRTAQRCFFLGLLVLGGLLAIDPWVRLNPTSPQTAATPATQDKSVPAVQGEQTCGKTIAPATSASLPSASARPTSASSRMRASEPKR